MFASVSRTDDTTFSPKSKYRSPVFRSLRQGLNLYPLKKA